VIHSFECVPSRGLFYHQSTSAELWLWVTRSGDLSRRYA
jgi:hypothetical protein